MTVELPEPVVPASSIITQSGVWEGLYTAAQLKEYGEACRKEALEEAAKVCDEVQIRRSGQVAEYCASAIRALTGETK